MAISFNKKEVAKKKQTKKQEKLKRREERKAEGSRSFEDMIAYVDENGMITDTPPDLSQKEEIEIEDIVISTPKKTEEEVITYFNGRVEFFNESKGYGFIKDLNSAEKYFFHINNAPSTIMEKDLVTFKLERGKKGMNAVEISITTKK